jgi:hypothetical protein
MTTTQPPVPPPHAKRYHLVLVPGFVGFDALGQLVYYAGVTEAFGVWRAQPGAARPDTSIHYFDNYPTASVRLRAKRLIGYLATRTARGEFSRGDSLALVGHSTGGLDIRLALYTMAEAVASAANALAGTPPPGAIVDGPTLVSYADILALVDRMAFLSVPQYGTNIADFAGRYAAPIQSLAKDAARGLALNHGALGRVRSKLFTLFKDDRSDLVQAVRDALDESDENPNDEPERQATEREARFALTAWLENMANDFSSILDLRSQTAARRDEETKSQGGPHSPAHFGPAARAREIAHWKKHQIRVHSFATRVPPALYASPAWAKGLVATASTVAPLVGLGTWFFRHVLTWIPAVAGFEALAEAAGVPVAFVVLGIPTAVFDIMYAACAGPGGPFHSPDTIDPGSIAALVRPFGSGATVPTSSAIQVKDSDGVVNTLSMLWPFDPVVVPDPIDLVDADHGDVIGHFALRKLPAAHGAEGRRNYSYDIFQSSFKLTPQAFAAVWYAVFDFCVRP